MYGGCFLICAPILLNITVHVAYFIGIVPAIAFVTFVIILQIALRFCEDKITRFCLWLAMFLWVGMSWWLGSVYAQHFEQLGKLAEYSHQLFTIDPLMVGLAPVLVLCALTTTLPVAFHSKKLAIVQTTPIKVIPQLPVISAPKPMVCLICRTRPMTDMHYEVCAECKGRYAHEILRVRSQKYRAKQAGEPATLTVAEWVQTLQSFKFLCAYCQSTRFEALEHYIPIGHGAGTTKENCVPACRKCNSQKSNKHPEK